MKFEDLQKGDIVNAVMDDIQRGIAKIEGSKIVYDISQFNADTPWIFAELPKDRECGKWHKIYFDKFHILPRGCMHCWKIVARPKNLEQLLEARKLQREMKLPSKCGVDMRSSETYKGIHLAFWYGPWGDLEGSRELYKEVRRKVRGRLSLDTPVILKRGCTEMENAFGPSHLWEHTPEIRFKEALLDTTFEVKELMEKQPLVIENHTLAFWIIYSHRMGDKSARKYIRNYPISMGSVPTSTYHDKLPEIREEVVPYEIEVQGVQENK